MKVLVYGSGVIGSYLTHVLCSAGNEVTVLARGAWKEHLERHGLRIHHHLQRKDTVDYPRVIGGIEKGDRYDAVFAVMPYDKIGRILDSLAAVNAPLVILVGNNMNPGMMHDYIQKRTVCSKELLFGFQSTAGKRDMEKGVLICERAGAGVMDVGGLHSLPSIAAQNRLSLLFRGTGYRLHFQPDMEAYLVCHLAAILPLGYITYANGGTMRSSTAIQRKQTVLASREAYGLLRRLGYPILPVDDDKFYEPSPRGAGMKALYAIMAKTSIGELVACAHCRNAYAEMELLDKAFEQIIARAPEYPMPNWQALKAQMPSKEELKRKYGRP